MTDRELERQLNEGVRKLATAVAQNLPAAQYGDAVRAAAARLYELIADGLLDSDEREIWAEKGSRAVLKIGRVGPLFGTKFAYERYRHAPVSSESQECELVVVAEFTVHQAAAARSHLDGKTRA